MSRILLRAFGALILLVSLLALPLTALAHGRAEAGDYEIYIGFNGEPAFQGDVNGAEFFVTNMKTGEPVKGLEETVKMEIIFGEAKRELPVEAQWGEEGAYIGYVQPTVAGDYTIHLWGEIEGTPLDIMMTSSPDTFSSIEPKANIGFPAADPTISDLQSQLETAKQSAETALQTAQSAAQSVQTAMTIGIVGAVLGLVGVGTAVFSLRARK